MVAGLPGSAATVDPQETVSSVLGNCQAHADELRSLADKIDEKFTGPVPQKEASCDAPGLGGIGHQANNLRACLSDISTKLSRILSQL